MRVSVGSVICEVFSELQHREDRGQRTEALSSFKGLCSVDQYIRPHAPNMMMTRCFKGYEKRGL